MHRKFAKAKCKMCERLNRRKKKHWIIVRLFIRRAKMLLIDVKCTLLCRKRLNTLYAYRYLFALALTLYHISAACTVLLSTMKYSFSQAKVKIILLHQRTWSHSITKPKKTERRKRTNNNIGRVLEFLCFFVLFLFLQFVWHT